MELQIRLALFVGTEAEGPQGYCATELRWGDGNNPQLNRHRPSCSYQSLAFSWISTFQFVICLWLISGVLKWSLVFFWQFYHCFLGSSFSKVLIPPFHRCPTSCWFNFTFCIYRTLIYFQSQNYTERSTEICLPLVTLPS